VSVDALLRMSDSPPVLAEPALDDVDLRALFHHLNNSLGVVLAHAELLEAKAPDPANRARAAQVVVATLESLSLVRAIRSRADAP
jgi:hypothetical protein